MSYAFQFDYGIEGVNLYAFIRPLGQETIWSTVAGAFVTYSVSDWANYDITMTEQSGSGTYFGTWPDVGTAGFYNFTIYQRAGGSPASTDTIVGTSGTGPLYYTPGDTPVPSDTVFSGTWYAHAASDSSLVSDTLYKRAGDTTLIFAMCCCNLPEVAAGETIASATWATSSPSGLTIANADFDDTNAWAEFSAGTAGVTYTVTTTITLSGGAVYVRSGYVTATST